MHFLRMLRRWNNLPLSSKMEFLKYFIIVFAFICILYWGLTNIVSFNEVAKVEITLTESNRESRSNNQNDDFNETELFSTTSEIISTGNNFYQK